MLKIISAYKQGIDALQNKKKHTGFINISSSYPFFSEEPVREYCERYIASKNLGAYAEWGSGQFSNFLFFLGDRLLQYNLMAFCRRQRDTALIECDVVSDILTQKIKETIDGNPALRFLRWQDIAEKPDFQITLEAVRNYSNENQRFAQQCTSLTAAGIRNRLKYVKQVCGKKSSKNALDIAKQYAVDGIAMNLYAYKDWPVSVSKYELPCVIKSIYNNEYPELSKALEISDSIGHIQAVHENETIYATFYDNDFERLVQDASKTRS